MQKGQPVRAHGAGAGTGEQSIVGGGGSAEHYWYYINFPFPHHGEKSLITSSEAQYLLSFLLFL